MSFDTPAEGLSFEVAIAREAERMKARREKAAQRRKARHDGFYDAETIEARKLDGPRMCSEPECNRPQKGRGFCEAHYKRWRRSHGHAN